MCIACPQRSGDKGAVLGCSTALCTGFSSHHLLELLWKGTSSWLGHKEPLRAGSPLFTLANSASAKILRRLWCFTQILPHTPSPLWCADSEMILSCAIPWGDALSSRHSSDLAVGFSEESWVLVSHGILSWAPFCVCSSASPSLTPHLALCCISPHPSRVIYLTSLGVGTIQCFAFSGKRDTSRAEFFTEVK